MNVDLVAALADHSNVNVNHAQLRRPETQGHAYESDIRAVACNGN
jgi:hypothetical protein